MVLASLVIVPFYAGVLGLFYIFLSVRTIAVRRRLEVAVGDGNNPELLRAVRVHANFAEYVPLGLILGGFLELQGHSHLVLHVVCLLLLSGRVLHAYGLSKVDENLRFRVAGMQLTFLMLALSSLLLIFGGPGSVL